MKINIFPRYFYGISIVFLLYFYSISTANAAGVELYFDPPQATIEVGKNIVVNLKIKTNGRAINAAEGKINFPKDRLKALSIKTTSSIFTFWAEEPSISQEAGVISFAGGTIKQFEGSGGTLMSIIFTAKKIGGGSIELVKEYTHVLAADGLGTAMEVELRGTNINVIQAKKTIGALLELPKAPEAPTVTSVTHPDETTWYSNNNPKLNWELTPDTTAVAITLNHNPVGDPDLVVEEKLNEKIFTQIEDGEWYVHIKLKNATGWGEITHRKIQIDTTSPEQCQITLPDGQKTSLLHPRMSFSCIDKTSGVTTYTMQYSDSEWFKPKLIKFENTYYLPPRLPGVYPIVVRAYDAAGNMTETKSKIVIQQGVNWAWAFGAITTVGTILLILLGYALGKRSRSLIR